MSTLHKIFGTLFPPPTSMLLFLIKSLGKKNGFAANNIDIGGRGVEWHLLPHILSMIVVGRLREIIVHFVIKAPYSQAVYLLI